MNYIEDVIIKLRDTYGYTINKNPKIKVVSNETDILDNWDIDFISSVAHQIEKDGELSTRQNYFIMKILKKMSSTIIKFNWVSIDDIDNFIDKPLYKKPLYHSKNVIREVKYAGDNKLVFRFKRNEILFNKLKNISIPDKTDWIEDITENLNDCENVVEKSRYDSYYHVWIVPVYRFNIEKIVAFMDENNFDVDNNVVNYLSNVFDDVNKPEEITVVDGIIKIDAKDNILLKKWITENLSTSITLTPKNSRRLSRIQNIFGIEPNPIIEETSKIDVIPKMSKLGWNLDPEQETIAQFLLDNDLRGIVYNEFHPNFDSIKLLKTVNNYNPDSIHILTSRKWFWSTIGDIDQEVIIHNILNFCDVEKIRSGSVILDIPPDTFGRIIDSELLSNIAREIPKIIFYFERAVHPWINIARFLCPNIPHPLYTKVVKDVSCKLQNIPLSSLATLYNVVLFPEFITDDRILKLISDENEMFHSLTKKWT